MDGVAAARLAVDGRQVSYLAAGPEGAPPLLLLHGAGFDDKALTWAPTLAALARTRRVIVPDLPGYGDSDDLAEAPGFAALSEWVPRFMDAAGLARADLAGVSMGGGMALWLAIHHPGRIRRVVPVCAYGLMSHAPHHALARAAVRVGALGAIYRVAAGSEMLSRIGLGLNYAEPGRITAPTVAGLRRVAATQVRRRSFDAFLAAEMGGQGLRTDLRPDLHRIAAPTLLVSGRADRIVPRRYPQDAAARIAGARHLCLPTGHWPMRERPDLFNAALADFLAG